MSSAVTSPLHRLLLAAALLLGASPAWGQYHTVKAGPKPIVKDGKVVGAKFKVQLSPARGRTKVRLGVGKAMPYEQRTQSNTWRARGTFKKEGYLHTEGNDRILPDNNSKIVDLNIMYGKGNKLKGGETVDLVSAWTDTSGFLGARNRHVWGMEGAHWNDKVPTYVLPKGTAKASSTEAAGTRSPASRQKAAPGGLIKERSATTLARKLDKVASTQSPFFRSFTVSKVSQRGKSYYVDLVSKEKNQAAATISLRIDARSDNAGAGTARIKTLKVTGGDKTLGADVNRIAKALGI